MSDIDAESELSSIPGLREKMRAADIGTGGFRVPSQMLGIAAQQRPPSPINILETEVIKLNQVAIMLEELVGILVGLDDKSPIARPANNVVEKAGGPVFQRLSKATADIAVAGSRMEELLSKLRSVVM